MTAAVLRKELHTCIDEFPDRSLPALKPLLTLLVESPYSIEPASPLECAKVEKRVRDYYKDPQSFTLLSSIK
ncbi:MAG: hypothetical protein FWC06_07865 [Treponema sp.]|nr:hypothetical protein [Treponema sp.]